MQYKIPFDEEMLEQINTIITNHITSFKLDRLTGILFDLCLTYSETVGLVFISSDEREARVANCKTELEKLLEIYLENDYAKLNDNNEYTIIGQGIDFFKIKHSYLELNTHHKKEPC